MLKSNIFIATIFSTFFFSKSTIAQSLAPNNKELVLEIPTITSKNYSEVKSALASTNGITLAAYCEEQKIILLYYDLNKIQLPEEIQKVVGLLDPSYKTKIRTNLTFSDIINSCNSFPLPSVFEER